MFSSPTSRSWVAPDRASAAREFHRTLPGYQPTPLIDTDQTTTETEDLTPAALTA